MFLLAFRNLVRRPLRNVLTIIGLAVAVAMLAGLSSFDCGYRRALGAELDRMGLQLMVVPLGCPYDAAVRVLKAQTLDNSLPEAALQEVRADPAVAVAAPMLIAVLPRPAEGRADMWVGIDETMLPLKPWWQIRAGAKWFNQEDSVLLGCDAAEVEMRAPGDLLFSPETGAKLQVAGVLERSGTSDDSLFFVPLRTAQKMFGQEHRLTAIAVRLRDPSLLGAASQRLQAIPGAQVVTLTEMMGTFLNLLGAARTLLLSLVLIAVAVSVLGVFNTLLGAVVERENELVVMRALGASRLQILRLVSTEGFLLSAAGSMIGLGLALVVGPGIETAVKHFVPLAPSGSLLSPTLLILFQSMAIGTGAGLLGGFYPAWRASRLQPAAALKSE